VVPAARAVPARAAAALELPEVEMVEAEAVPAMPRESGVPAARAEEEQAAGLAATVAAARSPAVAAADVGGPERWQAEVDAAAGTVVAEGQSGVTATAAAVQQARAAREGADRGPSAQSPGPSPRV
jgi:hypothetical protein